MGACGKRGSVGMWLRPVALLFAFMMGLTGCASVCEVGRGIAGTSTKILEEGRANALKQDFNCQYPICYDLVKGCLKKAGAYIYREDRAAGMIAFYVSETDTTPVGIFFRDGSGVTSVEVSSPSTFAKEMIMEKISADLKDMAVKNEKMAPAQESEAMADETK